jgi:hypothetical protein
MSEYGVSFLVINNELSKQAGHQDVVGAVAQIFNGEMSKSLQHSGVGGGK